MIRIARIVVFLIEPGYLPFFSISEVSAGLPVLMDR